MRCELARRADTVVVEPRLELLGVMDTCALLRRVADPSATLLAALALTVSTWCRRRELPCADVDLTITGPAGAEISWRVGPAAQAVNLDMPGHHRTVLRAAVAHFRPAPPSLRWHATFHLPAAAAPMAVTCRIIDGIVGPQISTTWDGETLTPATLDELCAAWRHCLAALTRAPQDG